MTIAEAIRRFGVSQVMLRNFEQVKMIPAVNGTIANEISLGSD